MERGQVRVDVVLFAYLAERTGGQRRVRCAGRTAREALADLTRRYPELHATVWAPDGGLSGALVAYVACPALAGPNGLDEPLVEGSEIALLPLAAGG